MAFAFTPRKPVALLIAALACALAPRAVADETHGRTSSLSWVRLEGAESCISTQELALAVEERLKRKVFVSAAEADVSVEGHIERVAKPPKWRATLAVRDLNGKELGRRELESSEADCSSLDEGLVLVVSLLIDPDAEQAAAAEKPGETPKPTREEKPPKTKLIVRRERVFVPVESKPERAWSVEAGAGVALGVGLLPGASGGVTSSVVVTPPGFWGVILTGAYWFDKSIDAEKGAHSDVSLAYGGAGLCPLGWSAARVSYRACAGVAVGALRSRGVGFDSDVSSDKPSVYVFVPNRFGFRIAGPLSAVAGVSLLVPLARTELTYRTADGVGHSLFTPAPLAGAADLGLALFFP